MIMEDDKFTDDMYDVDEFGDDIVIDQPSNDNPPSPEGDEPQDLTTELLRLKGITDTSKIQFEDETGAIVERSWDSLSRSEQLNILSDQRPEEDELDSDEIELINQIRQSGMNVQDYMQQFQAAVPTQPESSYKIDELSDDEVFVLDLLDKVGQENITDEEIAQYVANAKQNEKLYEKTVQGIRQEYIQAQKDEEARAANEAAARQQEDYNRFASSVVNEIRSFNEFMGQSLELDDDDQQELANFILELDDNGNSAFGKALNNRKYLTEAAFWILNKDKITAELTKQMQETYKRGYEQAKRDMAPKSKLAFQAKSKKNDDFVDDDDW